MEHAPENTYEWSAPEFMHIERSSNWFWAVGGIALVVFIGALMLDNLLFGIFALLAGFTSMLFGAKKPDTVSFRCDTKGIMFSNTMHPYNSLKSFWIIEETLEPKLLLQSKKTLMPIIILPLGDADADSLRKVLQNYLLEEEIEEPIPQKLMERVGF